MPAAAQSQSGRWSERIGSGRNPPDATTPGPCDRLPIHSSLTTRAAVAEPSEEIMNKPQSVAITGAAGNIGYALAFRIAAGDLLGPEQPVILQLIEIPPALEALRGVVMELNDCAFPLL